MSSFIIAKEEYIKAAGIVAAFAKEFDIWMYDREYERNAIAEDYKRKFEKCYEMNAFSVVEQYGEKVGSDADDVNRYENLFNEYYEKGRRLARLRNNDTDVVLCNLVKFMQSSLYQMENQECEETAAKFYNTLTARLFECTSVYRIADNESKINSWGSLGIGTEEKRTLIHGIPYSAFEYESDSMRASIIRESCKLLSHKGNTYHFKDAWAEDGMLFVVGKDSYGEDGYIALVINPKNSSEYMPDVVSVSIDAEYEYDRIPTRREVESDYVDTTAERAIDEAESKAPAWQTFI